MSNFKQVLTVDNRTMELSCLNIKTGKWGPTSKK